MSDLARPPVNGGWPVNSHLKSFASLRSKFVKRANRQEIQMKIQTWLLFVAMFCGATLGAHAQDPNQWLTIDGGEGPGKGKHVVFVSGDDEYRSEEACPMLAKILAKRYGFKCTVLFAIDPETGMIKPNYQRNIPGTHLLKEADMMVVHARFRELPDDQMAAIIEFTNSGKPIFGLRTSTHAFNYTKNGPYSKWSYNSQNPPGGWGQAVLGETWISHHGDHGKESTRGVINPALAAHPIVKGCQDIWGPTDVYGVVHLTDKDQVLVRGQVLDGMKPTDKPVEGKKNDPMQPLVWVREFKGETGKVSKVICTTMGASVDLQSEGLRRLCVNTVLWATGAEAAITDRTNVDYVGEYKPTMFGFDRFVAGKKPADYR